MKYGEGSRKWGRCNNISHIFKILIEIFEKISDTLIKKILVKLEVMMDSYAGEATEHLQDL